MKKLHITVGSSKMFGIHSINTSATMNPFCQMMSRSDTICKSCYALRFEAFRKHLISAFERNSKLLTDENYKPEILSHSIVRFHSMGELINSIHFNNFVKLAFKNPETIFTLWTKRKNIVQSYLNKGGVIPSNLIMIYSNPIVDNELKRVPKGFDKVFNVFNSDVIKERSIDMNCKKSCLDCKLCYSLNDVKVINEKKK